MLLIHLLNFLNSINVCVQNMNWFLFLRNWAEETDRGFIHSIIYRHPWLNSNWRYLRIENLWILLAEIGMILVLMVVIVIDLRWNYRLNKHRIGIIWIWIVIAWVMIVLKSRSIKLGDIDQILLCFWMRGLIARNMIPNIICYRESPQSVFFHVLYWFHRYVHAYNFWNLILD